jgi:hypothetical protein
MNDIELEIALRQWKDAFDLKKLDEYWICTLLSECINLKESNWEGNSISFTYLLKSTHTTSEFVRMIKKTLPSSLDNIIFTELDQADMKSYSICFSID